MISPCGSRAPVGTNLTWRRSRPAALAGQVAGQQLGGALAAYEVGGVEEDRPPALDQGAGTMFWFR
jgi:hypothetical protein